MGPSLRADFAINFQNTCLTVDMLAGSPTGGLKWEPRGGGR